MHNLYIVWEEGYNLGIPIIDEQHRAIVSTINTFHYFVTRGMTGTVLKPTLITLEQYTKTHFTTEEYILEQTEYPETINHKKLHIFLTSKMSEIALAVIPENDSDIVLKFLRKWWLNHIRVEDLKYTSHIRDRLELI